jgi:TfdA family taurine catabolism dioxygenase TauD
MAIAERSRFELADAVSALRERGMVLIRDPAFTVTNFVEATDQIMDTIAHHSIATGERQVVGEAVEHVATVNQGNDAIPLHRESSFLPTQPDVLALYCRRPPTSGGQTVVCDGVALAQVLPDPLRRFLDREQLVWRFRMPPQRWNAVLNTTSQKVAAVRIAELMKRAPLATYDYFFDDGHLDGTYRSPLLLPTFWQSEPALSTSVLNYYHRNAGPYVAKSLHTVTLSDGSAVPEYVLETITDCGERLSAEVTWQPGDMLLIDNSHVMHGRRRVQDTNRDIIVRMGHYRPTIAIDRIPAAR